MSTHHKEENNEKIEFGIGLLQVLNLFEKQLILDICRGQRYPPGAEGIFTLLIRLKFWLNSRSDQHRPMSYIGETMIKRARHMSYVCIN